MNPKNQQYILENMGKKSVQQMTQELNLKEKVIRNFLSHWQRNAAYEIKQDSQQNLKVANHDDKNQKAKLWLLGFFLVAINLVAFLQVKDHEFLRYDDLKYVYDNPNIKNGLSVKSIHWAFTSSYASNWHPLTWLVYIIQWQFFGDNPGAFHLVNLLFHIGSTLLCFTVFFILTNVVYRSFIIAALFAIHPMHVQSVAWVAELKDVLSTFFVFFSIFYYVKYTKNIAGRCFLMSIFFFALSLLSKQMYITLPVILLLFDYWPLKRFNHISFQKLVFEKIPFFVSAVFASAMTYWAQKSGGAIATFETISLGRRLANISMSYLKYILRFFYPLNLSDYYPWQQIKPELALALITMLGVASVVFFNLRKTRPYLFVGWCIYMVALAPVIGIIQIGKQAMADRYTYFPYLGLFIILAWGIYDYFKKYRYHRWILISSSLFLIIALTTLTYYEVSYWKNTKTRLNRSRNTALKNYDKAYLESASLLFQEKAYSEAENVFKQCIEGIPSSAFCWNGLALALDAQGKKSDAVEIFKKIIADDELKPRFVQSGAYHNLGRIYFEQGTNKQALYYFNQALEAIETYKGAESTAHMRQTLWALTLVYENTCDIVNTEKYAKKLLQMFPADKQAEEVMRFIASLPGKTIEEKINFCQQQKSEERKTGVGDGN